MSKCSWYFVRVFVLEKVWKERLKRKDEREREREGGHLHGRKRKTMNSWSTSCAYRAATISQDLSHARVSLSREYLCNFFLYTRCDPLIVISHLLVFCFCLNINWARRLNVADENWKSPKISIVTDHSCSMSFCSSSPSILSFASVSSGFHDAVYTLYN